MYIIIIITIIIIIIINHLSNFSASILHGSSSKTKIYGSYMFISNPIVEIFLSHLMDNDTKRAQSLKRICRVCNKFE